VTRSLLRVLRDYQLHALAGLRDALSRHASALCVLPTGCGKTTVAATLMNEWPGGNTLFLAHTRELVGQAAARLEGELGYAPVVEMGLRSGETDLFYQGGMCVVGSVQSMAGSKRLARYAKFPFDLIVIDESHRATARTYRQVVDYFRELNPNLKVVGLTATPNRADGTALGLVFESVGYSLDIEDAIDGGWLVPVRQRAVTVTEAQIVGGNKRNEFGDKDFTNDEIEKVFADEETLHGTAQPLVEQAGERPTIVFCSTVRHAHELAAVLNHYKPASAAAVDGETPANERAAMVRDFQAGGLQFLVNAQVFTEGFDAPKCACVAVARPTKSVGRYTQMVGRGLRPLAGVADGHGDAQDRKLAILTSDKPDCLVLDFVNAGSSGLATVEDALGGNYDAQVRAAAFADRAAGDKPVGESLRRAKFLLALERESAELAGRSADVSYDVFDRDGRPVASGDGPTRKRGTATDGQVNFLVQMGVKRETALAYSAGQARVVLDKMTATRCTDKQQSSMRRAGIDPAGINFERAKRIIDALAANNWRPLAEVPS
jgi:superfamily II DNA or RNA helicase